MVDRLLVERKLVRIETYLRELQSVPVNNLEEFKRNVVTKRFVERQLELCVEQMIDVCKHLVAGLDLPDPETYAACFDILAVAGVVPEQHLAVFKSMARFRNLLIHGYDNVDDAVTYGIFSVRLGDFTTFIAAIRGYLAREGTA
jgi:uncharacterized protein YutE (UPF0331/DUF86 family)